MGPIILLRPEYKNNAKAADSPQEYGPRAKQWHSLAAVLWALQRYIKTHGP